MKHIKRYILVTLMMFLSGTLFFAQTPVRKGEKVFNDPFFKSQNPNTPSPVQDKLHLIHADETKKSPDQYEGNPYLTGNVKFEHKGSVLTADLVIWYQDRNFVKAIGNTRLVNADGSVITAGEMEYSGETQMGVARNNVVLKDPKQTIKTETLYYERLSNKAYFNSGGTIFDGKNTMYTKSAVYNISTKMIDFSGNVKIENAEYTVDGANIIQDQNLNIAFFSGPTFIRNRKNPSNYVYTEKGRYEMNAKQVYLEKNSRIHYNNKTLRGLKMWYNQLTNYGKAEGKVELYDPEENRLVRGDFGEMFEKKDSAVIWGSAYAVKALEKDSAYFGAKKIIAFQKPDSLGKKKSFLRAFSQARFFKTNAQARADSISFDETDGIMKFFGTPILWSGVKQVSGDYMEAYFNTESEIIDSVKVIGHAMAISKADSLNMKDEFNQVKGRDMRVLFKNNEIHTAHVLGNGQTIVYVDEENKKGAQPERYGLALSKCGIIEALFEDRTLQILECSIGATTDVYPMSQVADNQRFFSDFNWNITDRLQKWQDIFSDTPNYPKVVYISENPFYQAAQELEKKKKEEEEKQKPKRDRKL